MIQCKYDKLLEAERGSGQGVGGGSDSSTITSPMKNGRTPTKGGSFQPISSMRLRSQRSRAPFVFEHYFPTERLLDPADLSPNASLLFESHLGVEQQRRLLRKMEKEQRLRNSEKTAEETRRRRREEEERAQKERQQAMSELDLLQQRYKNVQGRLSDVVEERKKTVEEGHKTFLKEEEAFQQRQLKRLRSSKSWALYEATTLGAPEREEVSTDDDQHTPQRGGGGDRQGAGVLSPSTIMFDSRANQDGATTTSSSSRKETRASHSGTAADDGSSTQSPPAVGSKSSSSVESPPRFERASEKRARLKALFGEAEADEGLQSPSPSSRIPAGSAGSGLILASSPSRRSLPPGVAARAASKPRIIVDL
jgi:hypothetical protein